MPIALLPHELRSPLRFAQGADFARVRDLVDAHAGELGQWSKQLEISPTAGAILAVHVLLAGIGDKGAGAQLSEEEWRALLGRAHTQTCDAWAELRDKGLAVRFRQLRSVATITKHRAPWEQLREFVDKSGRTRTRADCVAVSYATRRGLRLIERKGEIRRYVRGRGRLKVQGGLVGFLLEKLRTELRTIARRVAPVRVDRTPYADSRPLDSINRSRRTTLVGNHRPTGPPSADEVRPLGAKSISSSSADHAAAGALTEGMRDGSGRARSATAAPWTHAGAAAAVAAELDALARSGRADLASPAVRAALVARIQRGGT